MWAMYNVSHKLVVLWRIFFQFSSKKHRSSQIIRLGRVNETESSNQAINQKLLFSNRFSLPLPFFIEVETDLIYEYKFSYTLHHDKFETNLRMKMPKRNGEVANT